jgi:cytochrome b561
VFHEIHEILAFLMAGLLVLHILGALKHQFIDKVPSLGRMFPGRR